MDDLTKEIYIETNSELDKYLRVAILAYGIEQLKGNEPNKLYCCFRNKERQIIAGIMGSTSLNMFYISHLFVEPAYRNNGLGLGLLSEIENIALAQGCDMLRLKTLNKKTHGLYLNAGFKQTTRIPEYITGFDLVYYHKKIS